MLFKSTKKITDQIKFKTATKTNNNTKSSNNRAIMKALLSLYDQSSPLVATVNKRRYLKNLVAQMPFTLDI